MLDPIILEFCCQCNRYSQYLEKAQALLISRCQNQGTHPTTPPQLSMHLQNI